MLEIYITLQITSSFTRDQWGNIIALTTHPSLIAMFTKLCQNQLPPGAVSLKRCRLTGITVAIMKIRWCRIIFMMGIPIYGKTVFILNATLFVTQTWYYSTVTVIWASMRSEKYAIISFSYQMVFTDNITRNSVDKIFNFSRIPFLVFYNGNSFDLPYLRSHWRGV